MLKLQELRLLSALCAVVRPDDQQVSLHPVCSSALGVNCELNLSHLVRLRNDPEQKGQRHQPNDIILRIQSDLKTVTALRSFPCGCQSAVFLTQKRSFMRPAWFYS